MDVQQQPPPLQQSPSQPPPDVPPPIFNGPNVVTTTSNCYHGSVVLDIQCFKDSDDGFLLKEACLLDVATGTLLMHHIVRPPFAYCLLTVDKQRENSWLTRHCHGLEWQQGDIAYVVLLDKLRASLVGRPVVYVKGLQKRDFVRNHLLDARTNTTVVDMGEMGCGSINGPLTSAHPTVRCRHHKSGSAYRCALSNCVALRSWLMLAEPECCCCYY
jgi:hypothetical protein